MKKWWPRTKGVIALSKTVAFSVSEIETKRDANAGSDEREGSESARREYAMEVSKFVNRSFAAQLAS